MYILKRISGEVFTETNFIISKLSQSIIFRNIFICVEKSNYMKDYTKVRGKAWERDEFSPFSTVHWVLLNIKHLLEKNLRAEQYT